MSRLRPARLIEALLLGLLPAWLLLSGFGWKGARMVDLRVLDAGGDAAWHGRSPFPVIPADGTISAHCVHLPAGCFNYPAPAAWLMAPLAALPFPVTAALFYSLSALAIAGALYLLGVRDWRCYGISFLSAPVLGSLAGGTFSPLLLLAIAAVWRWRDQAGRAGVTLGLAVAVKIFPWPLLVWLAVTRRWRAAFLALLTSATTVLVAWGAFGFDDLRQYPQILADLSSYWQGHAYTPLALAMALGLGLTAAKALGYLIGFSLLGASARSRDERLSFVIIVAATLALTPIVWSHYFVLLLVPLALSRARLSWPWFLLLPFSPLPAMADGHISRIVLGLTLTTLVFTVSSLEISGRRLAAPWRRLLPV